MAFVLAVVIFILVSMSETRRVDLGPTVDPGVFVITQIQSCRNSLGYCILGYSCDVDKDFLPDDLGGNCDGLGSAFNPTINFVCCKENPASSTNPPFPEFPTDSKDQEDDGELIEAQKSSITTIANEESITESPTTASSQEDNLLLARSRVDDDDDGETITTTTQDLEPDQDDSKAEPLTASEQPELRVDEDDITTKYDRIETTEQFDDTTSNPSSGESEIGMDDLDGNRTTEKGRQGWWQISDLPT